MNILKRFFNRNPVSTTDPGTMLNSYDLPRPEFLLANMLVLKIAKLQPHEDYCAPDFKFNFELSPTSHIVFRVWVSSSGYSALGHVFLCRENGESKRIIFTPEEEALISGGCDRLHKASLQQQDHRRACISQDAALSAIELLVGNSSSPLLLEGEAT